MRDGTADGCAIVFVTFARWATCLSPQEETWNFNYAVVIQGMGNFGGQVDSDFRVSRGLIVGSGVYQSK